MEVKATVDEAVDIGKEIYGFWGKISAFFGTKPKARPAPKSVAKKKEKFVAIDETQVMADIVSQLTKLFRLEEQLATHIREAEEKSKNVYDPDANLMEAALQRVLAQQQMAGLVVTVREMMVYQSPPEMGALYSKVFEMRDVIATEQEAARLAQEAKKRQDAWRHRQEERNLQAKLAAVVGTSIFLLYLWLWLLFVSQWGKK
jgi:Fe2+ transport system protein B